MATPRRKSKTSEDSAQATPEVATPAAAADEVTGDAPEAAQIGFAAFGEDTHVRPSSESATAGSADVSAADSAPEAAESAPPAAEAPEASAASESSEADGQAAASEEASPPNTRRRIEEQLEALKRREAELRRELAVADHPELAEALRTIEGHTYAVARVEAKMAQGLSKAEERRRETLEKKLASAREKRQEIDAQIAELEAELAPLGEARTLAFEAERRECMERLLATLGTHEGAFRAAGLDTAQLVPDLSRLMPEVRSLAESLSAQRLSLQN